MSSPTMEETPEDAVGDLHDLPSSPCSDIGDPELSPESKKILERFTMSASEKVPISDVKNKPSLILRPKTSGIFAAGGFQFAKPARPANSFSIRPCNKEPTSAHPKLTSKAHKDNDADSVAVTTQRNDAVNKESEEFPADASSLERQRLSTTITQSAEQPRQEVQKKCFNYTEKDGGKREQPSREQRGHETTNSPNFDSELRGTAKSGLLTAQLNHGGSVEKVSHSMFTTPQVTNIEKTPSTIDPTPEKNDSTLLEDTQLTSPCRSPNETPSKQPQHRVLQCKETHDTASPSPLIRQPSYDKASLVMGAHDDRSLALKPTPADPQAREPVPRAAVIAACETPSLAISKGIPKQDVRRQTSGHVSKPVLTPRAPKALFGASSVTKITKRPMQHTNLRSQPGASWPGTSLGRQRDNIERPPVNRGPSEEDLFMMLIGRLKKRDEIENLNRATKERLQKEIMEANQKNAQLCRELQQAGELQQQQEERLKEWQEMIERWRAKFCKLKDLANNVGSAFENVRVNGKQLKETQQSLLKESDELQRDMRQIHMDNEKSQRNWHCYIENVNDVKKGVIKLQTSVAVAETQAQERDRAIREERCRVAKLENHIRTYCIRQLKETSAMYDMESDMFSRIKTLSKAVESLRAGASVIGEGMGKDIGLILEILRHLSERETITPADLSACQGVIEQKWSQLRSSVETSFQNLEGSSRAQTSQGDGMMSKLAEIKGSLVNIFERANVISEAQDTQKALQAKLDSALQSLTEITQERERLRSSEHKLQIQVERMAAEMERLRRQSDEAAEIRTSEAFIGMQQQLEKSQTALSKAKAQRKLEESALQAMQEQVREMTKRAEEAEAATTALNAEKAEIEAKASQVELSIRQELTRASLAAKEQNKAWLDQEKHKLHREKQQGEKVLEAMKQQLEMTTASLEKANGMYDASVAKEKELKKQNDDLKKASAKSEKDLQSRVQKLEDAQREASKALETAQQESLRLRAETEQLQAQSNDSEGSKALKHQVSELDNLVKDKTALVSSLQDQLQQLKTSAGMATKLRQELDERRAETENLRKQLEDVAAESSAAAVSLKSKDTEISELLNKLTLAEKERNSLQQLQAQADEKQQQLQRMNDQRAQSDTLLAKVEALLRRSGLLSPDQSLIASWDTFESHLEQSLQRARKSSAKEVDSSMTKAVGKRKRSAAHFEFIPESKLGECSTREVIYQTCRIRESASPKKNGRPRRVIERKKAQQMEPPPIKSFSQLQNEARLSPGTPPGMKDLDLLFSTPAQEQQPQEKMVNLDTQSTKKSTSENMLLDEVEVRQSQASNGNNHKEPTEQMQTRGPQESVHIPETQLQEPLQPSQPLEPRRGILKDSTSIIGGQTPRAIRTPSNKITGNTSTIELAVNGAFRRPSRIGSKFFDPLPPEKEANSKPPPAQAEASVPDEIIPIRPLRKTRGRYSRKKGNYNDRFLRELKN